MLWTFIPSGSWAGVYRTSLLVAGMVTLQMDPKSSIISILFCFLTPGIPGQVIVAGLHFSEPLSQEWAHLPLLLLPKSCLCGERIEESGHVSAPSGGLLCGADCIKTWNGFPFALYWSMSHILKILCYTTLRKRQSNFTLSLSGLLFLSSLWGYEKTRKKRDVWDIWTLADKVGVRVFQLQEPSGAAAESP